MSGSQRELVDIMQQVKTKHLTVDEAEEFFYDWKMRHERGFTRSFRQKQVRRLPVSLPVLSCTLSLANMFNLSGGGLIGVVVARWP